MSEAFDNSPSVNPYAAPSAELHPGGANGGAGGATFYAVSPLKVVVMSVLTMGIYDLCFWWRHWRAQRQGGRDVSLFWRTFFSALYFFEFKKTLSLALARRSIPRDPLLSAAPSVYLVCYAIGNVQSRLTSSGVSLVLSLILMILHSSALGVTQRSINLVLEADGYRGAVNRGASARTYLIGFSGILLWGLSVYAALYMKGGRIHA